MRKSSISIWKKFVTYKQQKTSLVQQDIFIAEICVTSYVKAIKVFHKKFSKLKQLKLVFVEDISNESLWLINC